SCQHPLHTHHSQPCHHPPPALTHLYTLPLHDALPISHQTDRLAELVCSNSFKSVELANAHGLLKAEMRRIGSVVLEAADAAHVRSEEHTSELQSRVDLVCRLLLEKKKIVSIGGAVVVS